MPHTSSSYQSSLGYQNSQIHESTSGVTQSQPEDLAHRISSVRMTAEITIPSTVGAENKSNVDSKESFDKKISAWGIKAKWQYFELYQHIKDSFENKKLDISKNNFSQFIINNVDDLPDLSDLPWLETIKLSGLKNMGSLPVLPTSLKTIEISFSEIKDLSCFSALPHLETIKISGMGNLESLPVLPTSLKTIEISFSEIKDLSCLSTLPHLETIKISGMENFESLPVLPTSLKTIEISSSEIKDLSCLSVLPHLEIIKLSGLKNMRSLPVLPASLKAVEISSSGIKSLPDLSYLKDLNVFNIYNNHEMILPDQLPGWLEATVYIRNPIPPNTKTVPQIGGNENNDIILPRVKFMSKDFGSLTAQELGEQVKFRMYGKGETLEDEAEKTSRIVFRAIDPPEKFYLDKDCLNMLQDAGSGTAFDGLVDINTGKIYLVALEMDQNPEYDHLRNMPPTNWTRNHSYVKDLNGKRIINKPIFHVQPDSDSLYSMNWRSPAHAQFAERLGYKNQSNLVGFAVVRGRDGGIYNMRFVSYSSQAAPLDATIPFPSQRNQSPLTNEANLEKYKFITKSQYEDKYWSNSYYLSDKWANKIYQYFVHELGLGQSEKNQNPNPFASWGMADPL